MNTNPLKKIPLFSSLDQESLTELEGYLRKRNYAAYQAIFWMNEKGDHLYIVESGKVRISYNDEEGKEVDLNTLGPGAFFGELSLIDGGTHSATARTVTDTVLLTLDRNSFYLFLNKHPQVAHTLLEVMSQRVRNSTSRMEVVNVNDQLEAERSKFQVFIDKVAIGLTSSTFLTLYVIFIVGWITSQVYFYKKAKVGAISFMDHPPTFFILGFFITLTSFLLTILILNSQRRQAENDRIRGEIEYQVNVKSQMDVMKLHAKIDRLIETVGHLMNEEKPDGKEK